MNAPGSLDDYIAAHIAPEPPELARLYHETGLTKLYPRMCTDHINGRILKMLTAMIAPRRVVEIGTFTGYSALCIAEALPPDGLVDTIEIDDESEAFIRRHLDASAHGRKVRLHIGDALDIVPRLDTAPWDMALIDGNKRHYTAYLDALLPRLAPGAFILADNILWGGKIASADPSDPGLDAQTRGIIDFNRRLASDPRLETVILPIADGLSIARVNPR